MGARAALENVRYFLFQLMPRAECGAPWTQADLDSALMWADYCQRAALAAVGTAAEAALIEFLQKTGQHRPDLDVSALCRSRRLLLMALLQNHRLTDAVTRSVIAELRQLGALDAVVAELAQLKQAYQQLTALVRRGGTDRRRQRALLGRRYLADERRRGDRSAAWLREKVAELASGPGGAVQVALALTAATDDPEPAVDAALTEELVQMEGDWARQIDEEDRRRLLAQPGVTGALLDAVREHTQLPEADTVGTESSGVDGTPSEDPGRGGGALLLEAARRDASGRFRCRLHARLSAGGERSRRQRTQLVAQMPGFRLRCSSDSDSGGEAAAMG